MKNNFAVVREQKKDNKLFLFVDTKKANLRGMPWMQLGDWGKKKFENMLFVTRIQKEYVKVQYLF